MADSIFDGGEVFDESGAAATSAPAPRKRINRQQSVEDLPLEFVDHVISDEIVRRASVVSQSDVTLKVRENFTMFSLSCVCVQLHTETTWCR